MSTSKPPKALAELVYCEVAGYRPPKWSDTVVAHVATEVAPPSALEAFYQRHEKYRRLVGSIALGSDPSHSETLYELSLLGLVSTTETYFRELHSSVLAACAVSRRRARDEQITFGALGYYPTGMAAAALTEHTSFTHEKAFTTFLKKYWDINIQQHSDLHGPIANFVVLANLRHAIVHSGGVLNSRNVAVLEQVFRVDEKMSHQVRLTASDLDQAAGICLDLVRSVNNTVARAVTWDWVSSGRIAGNWQRDRVAYAELLSLFSSNRMSHGQSRQQALAEIHKSVKFAIGEAVRRQA